MSRVVMLGLGAMGSRMATRLAEAGHDLVVWNRTASTADELAALIGATTAPTPAHAVVDAEIVISMLTDDDASAAVWFGADGALAAVPAGSTIVEASTVTASHVRRLAAAARDRRLAVVEAPVVGSRPQADAGALVTLAGGDPAAVAEVEPVLGAYSGVVRPTGDIGSAATLKLAINGLFAMQVAAYAETVGVLQRAGVDPARSAEVLGGLPITSPGLVRILGLIAEEAFEPNFPVTLVAKDLRYLASLALEVDGAMPMAGSAADVFSAAVDEGHGALDIAGVAARYLDR